jgi:hypothetical protein
LQKYELEQETVLDWRYDEDGRARVAQVDRQGCALILADTWPENIGKGLMFISVNVQPETREAVIAALDALSAELEAKGVLVKEGSWGYRLLVVDDAGGRATTVAGVALQFREVFERSAKYRDNT